MSLMQSRLSLAFLSILFVVHGLYAQQAGSPEILDNSAVVRMVQANLGADVIIGQIMSSPGNYTLTAASLISLKRNGVPDTVIAAMQKKSGRAATGATAPPMPDKKDRAYSPQGAVEVWEPDTWTAYMTGEKRPVIFTRVAGTAGSRLRVQAMCVDETWIDLSIENETPNRNLKRTEQARAVGATSTEGLFGSSVNTSGSIGPASSCVVANVRADSGAVKEIVSGECDKDNLFEINFHGVISRERYHQMLKEHPDIQAQLDHSQGAMNFLTGLFSSSSDSSQTLSFEDMGLSLINSEDDGNLRMADLLSSTQVRIGLPFQDGSFSTIDLHPQQPLFKAYAASCMSKAPAPDVKETVTTMPTVAGPSTASPPPATLPPPSSSPAPRNVYHMVTRSAPDSARPPFISRLSTDDGWDDMSSFIAGYAPNDLILGFTKAAMRDPNPSAGSICDVPANTKVLTRRGDQPRGGLIPVFILNTAVRNEEIRDGNGCSNLFRTTPSNFYIQGR